MYIFEFLWHTEISTPSEKKKLSNSLAFKNMQTRPKIQKRNYGIVVKLRTLTIQSKATVHIKISNNLCTLLWAGLSDHCICHYFFTALKKKDNSSLNSRTLHQEI